MTHNDIMLRVTALLVDAAEGDASMTGYGLGRTLECIAQVCEVTKDPMAMAAHAGIMSALHAMETSEGFEIVDVTDTRSDAELDAKWLADKLSIHPRVRGIPKEVKC